MLTQWSSLVLGALPYIQIPDGHIGPVPIHPFGVLVVIGILVGAKISTIRATRAGLDREQFSSLVFWTVASGIVISHMLDTIFYYPEKVLHEPWALLMVWQGLSSFGGFFGAAVGFLYYAKKHRISIWRSADAIAYGLPFGWFFGRLGCSVVHDHPGVMSTSFLAVAYPEGSRFDLGLLEVMLTPLLMLAVVLVGRYAKRPGAVVTTLALVYPFLRFPLDFLRAPEVDGGDVRYFGLTPGHYACLLLLALGVYLLLRIRASSGSEEESSTPEARALPKRKRRRA